MRITLEVDGKFLLDLLVDGRKTFMIDDFGGYATITAYKNDDKFPQFDTREKAIEWLIYGLKHGYLDEYVFTNY